jgi:NADPH:quinone reductase-like Zn-dependent oxidoreductase
VPGFAGGDLVFGTADWAGAPAAGASDRAIMDHWALVPAGLDLTQAAALPMAVETAYRSLAQLGLSAEHTILIHGAGTAAARPHGRLLLLPGWPGAGSRAGRQ